MLRRANIVIKNSNETEVTSNVHISSHNYNNNPGPNINNTIFIPHHIAPCHFTSSSVSPSASFLDRIHYHKKLNVLYLFRLSAWKVK